MQEKRQTIGEPIDAQEQLDIGPSFDWARITTNALAMEPRTAIEKLCEMVTESQPRDHYDWVQAYGLLLAIADILPLAMHGDPMAPEYVRSEGLSIRLLMLGEDEEVNANLIRGAFKTLSTEIATQRKQATLREAYDRVREAMGKNHWISLTESEYATIQKKLDALRDQVQAANIPDEHKQRILQKIVNVQRELHRKMPTVEKIYGLGGMIGAFFAGIHDKAEPVINTAKDLMRIAFRAEVRAVNPELALDVPAQEFIQKLLTSTENTEEE